FKRSPPQIQNILSNCNGFLQPGKMLAIIGASGSGKSTLLQAIFQRTNDKIYQVSGDVTFNGNVIDKHSTIRQFVGFVHQEEAYLSSLTVDGTLSFICRLAFTNESKDFREEMV